VQAEEPLSAAVSLERPGKKRLAALPAIYRKVNQYLRPVKSKSSRAHPEQPHAAAHQKEQRQKNQPPWCILAPMAADKRESIHA